MDKLNEAMALAEIDQHDQRSEELDIEAVLGFAERVSLNAPRLWLEASLDQRQRISVVSVSGGNSGRGRGTSNTRNCLILRGVTELYPP
jgi:hypothetical protein